MQDRTRKPPRRPSSFALASLALAVGVTGLGCTDDGPLSDEEMQQLRQFTLPPSGPPADKSNAHANDPALIALGKLLYFDGRYSGGLLAPYNFDKGINGALGKAGVEGLVSCKSCHDPATAGADRRSQPNATSLGAGYTGRNAPTVINAAYSARWQFWDGRADSLWSQALGPPEGMAESHSSRLRVVHFLYDHMYYRDQFQMIFGADSLPATIAGMPPDGMPGKNPDPTMTCTPSDPNESYGDDYDCLLSDDDKMVVDRAYANFGKAIAAYEGLLTSDHFQPSAFDRFMAGDKQAMEPAAIRGARLFVGHAGCAECHRGPTFTDFKFHNIGVPQTGEYASPTDDGRYEGVARFGVNVFNRSNDNFSDNTTDTTYVADLKASPSDSLKGQFKTPTLRNVAKTAPYMHDGVYQTLWDVVNHYNFGGATGNYEGEKDPAIAPLMLTNAELGDLVEFLEALDDDIALPSSLFPPDEGLIGEPKLPD